MRLDIQLKLNSNPNYIDYLHNNSYWYKILNREPERIDDFIKEVNKNYKLRNTDKIVKALDMIEVLENILSTLK